MVSDRLFALIALPAALALGALGIWLWGLILGWW